MSGNGNNGTFNGGKAITAVGNAQLDTAQSKFEGASGLFDGSGDYLSAADSDDWNFGAGDFTIDFWVRFNALTNSANYGFVGQQNGGSAEQGFYWYFTHYATYDDVYFRWRATDAVRVGYNWKPVFAINTWYHLVAVRDGTNFNIYLNGVSQSLTTENAIGTRTLENNDGVLTIAREANGFELNGWLDELRVSKGIARWTSNFTPPASAYLADSSDVLLIHADGTDASTTFYDDSQIRAGKFGNARYFNGTDDYVDCGTNFFGADYSTTNNISVEMWIKADKINTHQALFDKHTYPSNYGYGCGMWLNNNNKIEVEVGNGGSGTGSSRNLTSLQAGMWYHVVWVANGTTGRIYINGVDDSDLTAALKIYQNAPVAVWIGKAHSTFRYIQPTVPDNFNGLIDEVRIYSRALTSTEISDLYNASKARLDYGDLRFGDASRSTLSYWLESDKKAWVKISFLPASTTTPIYMYYGNSAASSASNGTTTFLAYADSNDYSTQFTSDSASVEGNEIKISSTPGWATGWIKANENLDRTTTNYELVFNMRSTGISPNDDETYGGFGSSNMMSSPYTDSGSFVAGSSALEIYEYTSQKYSSATGYDYTINNEFKIKINSTNRYYYLNNALLYTSSDTTTVAKTGITLYGNGPIYFKNIRLRKYASSEPAVAAPSNEQDVNNKGWLYGDYYAQNLATVPSPVSFDSLNVTCPSCQSLAATWTPSLWAERYKYDRCNNVSDCSGCNSGNTSSTNVLDGFCQSTQCSVTDSLTEGTGYCYKLYAYNSTGSTQNSDGSKFKQTPYCPPPQMGVNGYECGKLKTSWCRQGQENTDGYLVYRSLLSDGCNTTSSPTCEITGFLGEALDDNGLVGHWKLNETSGAVIDSSGLGNNGTNYGATTGVAGKFNKAYSFDGANDYVSVPYGDFVNESFSWSGWIKIDTNDYRMITDDRNTSSWNGWYIRHRGDNGDGSRILDFYVKNASGQTGITGTTQPNLGQWYHLVVTYEYIGNGTSKMNMYVNGAKDATEITNAYGVDAASADNRIGCYSGGGGAWVDGIIDNVAIYNRALTPEEIRKAYEASPLSSSCVYTCNGSKFCNPTSDTCCNTLYCNNKTCIYPDRKVIPDVNYYYRTISTTGANKSDFSDKVSGKTICVPPSLMREK